MSKPCCPLIDDQILPWNYCQLSCDGKKTKCCKKYKKKGNACKKCPKFG